MMFEFGAIVVDLLVFALGTYLCYLGIVSKRASAGLRPRSSQLPLLPVKALFILIGIYTICWSAIQIGLDFGFLNGSSKSFLLLRAFNRSIGRAFVEIFLLIWFTLFGSNMARQLFSTGKARSTRLIASLAVAGSILVVVGSCCLLVRLFKMS